MTLPPRPDDGAASPAAAPPPPVPIEDLLAHADWVRALAHRLVHDRSLVDDVVQNTWVAALRNPPRDAGRVRGWLRKVVRNQARETWRLERRRAVWERSAAAAESVPGGQDGVDRGEAVRTVATVVAGLPAELREVIRLRYQEQLGAGETAMRLGISETSVRNRLDRGCEAVRRSLRERAGGDDAAWTAALLPLFGGPAPEGDARVVRVTPRHARSAPLRRLVAGCVAAALLVAAFVALAPRAGVSREAGSTSGTATGSATLGDSGARDLGASRGVVRDASRAPASPELASSSGDVTLMEPTDRTVAGRVLDADGTAVASGRVVVRTISSLQKGPSAETVATVRDGAYRVDVSSIAPPAAHVAEFLVTVDSPEHLPATVRVPAVGPDGRQLGRLVPPDVALVRAAVVEGCVVGVDGAPVGGADVGLFPEAGGTPAEACTSGPDGAFRLRGARSRSAALVAAVDGRCAALVRIPAEGAPGRVELRLGEGVALTGRIAGPDGLPVGAGVLRAVTQTKGPGFSFPSRRLALCDDGLLPSAVRVPIAPDGTFAVCGLSPGRRYRLHVQACGALLDLQQRTAVETSAPADGVELRVSGASVEVTVTSRGTPVASAGVRVAGGSAIDEVVAGADGRVRVLGIPGAKYTVTARAPGCLARSADVVAGLDGVTRLALDLEPAPAGGRWALSLRDAHGAPIRAAGVALFDPREPKRPLHVFDAGVSRGSGAEPVAGSTGTKSEEGGARALPPSDTVVRVDGLPPGTWRAVIRPGGPWGSAEGLFEELACDVTILPGGTVEQTLEARAAGRLRVLVHGPDGAVLPAACAVRGAEGPVPVVFAERWVQGGSSSATHLGSEGATDVSPALRPGAYKLEVSHPGYAPRAVVVEVVVGRITQADLRLDRN